MADGIIERLVDTVQIQQRILESLERRIASLEGGEEK